MKRIIKEQDIFGHQIAFNFDKQGSSHKTSIGGIVSILIKVLMLIYVFILLKRMFLLEQNRNSTLSSLNKADDIGQVAYS